MHKHFVPACTLFLSSLLIVSCQKQADLSIEKNALEETQQTISSAESDVEADVIFNDVFDNVMGVDADAGLGSGIGIFSSNNSNGDITVENTGVDSTRPTCFTVTVVPKDRGVYPKTYTIDFGSGCVGRDGKTRKGKIITVFTGAMSVAGSKATTTFDGHYVDSAKIEGTHTVTNNSTSNNRSFTVKVENGKISFPSDNYITWNKNKTWLQTEGNGTPNSPLDDVFSISGSASGSCVKNGTTNTWSKEITENLLRRFTCRWIVKGKVTIKRNDNSAVIDFGDGSCDNKATVTSAAGIKEITMR